MGAYEEMILSQRAYAQKNKEIIQAVLKTDSLGMQEVLWMKSVWDDLCDADGARSFRSEDGTFGATERLVNRLMMFAYLKGQRAVDERSYRRGWEDAQEAMQSLLIDLTPKESK